MANPLPVVQQIHNIIRNDPGIAQIEELQPDAPAEKTLVSWIKRAPRAIANMLKKGKVHEVWFGCTKIATEVGH